MTIGQGDKITELLLNGTITSINHTIPIDLKLDTPAPLDHSFKIEFGVLIGITGDIRGKLLLSGDQAVFGFIGESLFGMELAGEMLQSFSGELGNMLAGGLSSAIADDGLTTDITAPTLMEGHTTITGFKKGVKLPLSFEKSGEMIIYILLD
ncbi:chemotaxis protein CheX [Cytobacillus purgationiresistens]|uniref:Chemotaxis protein CheX n=1 Tax=Cytobacillus purgationiresistens TaxID=863449 RepID=A0ABU0AI41_9BACI|nr:chemotaxis protein CheX [Cytobacillus purgationiresistens]MDQ0270559.1 chemotaxis protein CheX [Cytobacillus purgationiresistens]